MKPQMNYEFLRDRMKLYGYTQRSLAIDIPMSRGSLISKFKNDVPFNQSDIYAICNLLDIPPNKVGFYFFTPVVQKTE